jgi:hypothetical protein
MCARQTPNAKKHVPCAVCRVPYAVATCRGIYKNSRMYSSSLVASNPALFTLNPVLHAAVMLHVYVYLVVYVYSGLYIAKGATYTRLAD